MTTQSVGEAFPGELKRCRELLKQYEDLGVPGIFGNLMTSGVIARAEQAQASGDVVAIVRAYAEMRECE